MPTVSVSAKLVPIALREVDTSNFEKFGQSFFAGIMGKPFVPLGGVHDGGADGFFEPEMFEDASATHFLQISKQQGYDGKIRATVERLVNFGRHPKSLTYLTSEIIPHIDVAEESMSEELGFRIIIRDAKFIEANINYSPAIIAAFETYLAPCVRFLEMPGATSAATESGVLSDRTLAVFLRQEVEYRQGKTALLESVADNGHRFMMRPEFLLNFISFAPDIKDVAKSYREVFPSVLGIRLSNRVSADTFREVLRSANEIFAVDEARATSMITTCVNQLKGDTLKIYENNYSERRS